MATINPPPRRPIGDGCNGPAPTYAHAVEAFLIAHDRARAWSAGTAVKYRQSLTILGTRLAQGPTGASIAALDTPAGAGTLEVAFIAAFATLAPATRARHLAALRSALGWWRVRGWLVTDPTAGWARPKIARDHSRALTREQIAALWRLDVGLREKTLLVQVVAVRLSSAPGSMTGELMRRVVAIANGKGGVGKTSLTAGLAGLVANAGYRVLTVDADPQGNLRRDLGYPGSDGTELCSAVLHGQPVEPLREVRPNLDCVPGGPALHDFVRRVHLAGQISRARLLGIVAVENSVLLATARPFRFGVP